MKINKEQLQKDRDDLSIENDHLHKALAAQIKGGVTWFRKGQIRLGICGELSASGGTLIFRELENEESCGLITAYGWEAWFSRIRDNVPSFDNKEAVELRNLAYEIYEHVGRVQKEEKIC